jgi:hypothetical protein
MRIFTCEIFFAGCSLLKNFSGVIDIAEILHLIVITISVMSLTPLKFGKKKIMAESL